VFGLLVGLIVILLVVLVLPFVVKQIEHNLELFLFVMGLLATIVSGTLNKGLVMEILKNHLLYMIAFSVLVSGIIFKLLRHRIQSGIRRILHYVPLKVFIFLAVISLGLFSSMITAIIASLVLVEIVNNLPLNREDKISLAIIACFSIGLGAVLTPVGEPLATIVVSRLNQDFWYLAGEIGLLILPAIVGFGLLGGMIVKGDRGGVLSEMETETEEETYTGVVLRAVKVFIFVMALEFLGAGIKPLVDTYVVALDSRLLYPLNMISAVLDNATLASAEVSLKMNSAQIGAILMGLLISGGMLIPGNIPNIISAGKLKITSREWAKLGMPLGLTTMVLYYVILFVI